MTPRLERRYEELSRHLPFVAVLGEEMPREPIPGVRGAALQKDDPLTAEWLLSVISPYTALLLSGREIEKGPDGGRFEVALTFDREKAVAASTLLVGRLTEPAGADAVEVSDLVEFATVM